MKLRMPRKKEYMDDYGRIAQVININHGNEIKDRDSFDLAYSIYMQKSDSSLTDDEKNFRNGVFNEYSKQYKVTKDSLFKEAGGSDLVQDRKKTASTVVNTRREYIKRGARSVDLEDYDTKIRYRKYPTKVRGKVVYSSKEYVTVKGKQQLRYRDSRGRFASAK